jgi:lysophospholipase L1-like esterase
MSQPIRPVRVPDRRELLAALGGAACLSAAPARATAAQALGMVADGDLVLFQGDSITDAGRDRAREAQANDQAALGGGYAFLAAAGLLCSRPEAKLRVHNRGISGHKVHQLAERWDADCLDLRPDLVSILIGVNDIWHKRGGHYDGTLEVYERDYDALLERTKQALPQVRLVVCEPFVLRCGAIDDSWFPEFDGYRAAARRVADKHAAAWVGFHAMFEQAVKLAPPEHWAGDGVHPSAAGAALMAQEWLRVVRG